MPLHSVGRKLQTVGGAPLRVGGNALLNERNLANLCPPFSQWTLSGGATVTADGILDLPVLNAKAVSPLIFINGSEWMTLSTQGYTEVASPYASFNGQGGRLFSAAYYAADGVTTAYTTVGNYGGNGNARAMPLNVWTNRSTECGWNIGMGSAIIYAKWTIQVDATYTSRPIRFREPMAVAPANTFTPYGLYYRKGL